MKLRLLKVSMLCVAIMYVLGESGTFQYRIVANKRFLKTFKNETEVTEITCCRLCSVTVGCDIVNYKTTERTCELGEFEAGDDPHMVSATGWNMIYETGCNTDWVVFGNSCYYLQRSEYNWEDAETSCVNQGSHLVAINSEAENNFIGDLLDSNGVQNGMVWIGGRNLSNGFHWPNGEAVGGRYNNWGDGEPDNPMVELCMMTFESSSYTWHNTQCSVLCISICEKSETAPFT